MVFNDKTVNHFKRTLISLLKYELNKNNFKLQQQQKFSAEHQMIYGKNQSGNY